MAEDRVNNLLAAYFTQPYVEYGDVALDIRDSGGLTTEEVRAIKSQVSLVDANAMIRQTGSAEE
jgi:hypothetical protein